MKISKIILNTITVLFFVLALYIMIFGSIAAKKNELLSIFGYSYSAVPTDSMEGSNKDSFNKGSFVISKKVKFEDIKVNDIVIYQSTNNILVVHRVVAINDDKTLVMKGDNNSIADSEFVSKDNYQAKVIYSFNFLNLGEKIPTFQIQLLMIMIVVLIIFIIYQLFNIMKMIGDNKLKKIANEEREKFKNELK